MIHNKLIFFLLLKTCLTYSQTYDKLIVKHFDSNFGIKNVNVVIPKLDTTLITDTAGIVDLSFIPSIDTMIIKKFGYEKQLITKQREIFLKNDSLVYSHKIKLLDLKFKDGLSFIELSINGDNYWFKQKSGPLFIGNGRELETGQDYSLIFNKHKIIKTVSVISEYCLWKIRGENSANWITVIYYDPSIKKRITYYVPGISWYSKRKMKKDTKILKLQSGCLD